MLTVVAMLASVSKEVAMLNTSRDGLSVNGPVSSAQVKSCKCLTSKQFRHSINTSNVNITTKQHLRNVTYNSIVQTQTMLDMHGVHINNKTMFSRIWEILANQLIIVFSSLCSNNLFKLEQERRKSFYSKYCAAWPTWFPYEAQFRMGPWRS